MGLWSRFPIIDSSDEFQPGLHPCTGTDTRGRGDCGVLICRHRVRLTSWREDICRLGRALRTVATTGPVIVGSDLNAAPDVREFQQLLHQVPRRRGDQRRAG